MRNYISIFLLFLFTLSACKKETATPARTIAKIKSETMGGLNTTYTYDGQGRQIRKDYQAGNYGTYSYNSNGLIVEAFNYNSSGVVTSHFKYYLNSKGMADSLMKEMSGSFITTQKYFYDESNHLVTMNNYFPAEVLDESYYYVYENGNQISSGRIKPGGIRTQSTTYVYDSSVNSTLGNENQGISFLGLSSEKLVISESTYLEASNLFYVGGYIYTHDSRGRIITKQTRNYDGTLGPVTSYSYYD